MVAFIQKCHSLLALQCKYSLFSSHNPLFCPTLLPPLRSSEEDNVGSEAAEGASERRKWLRASSKPLYTSIQPRRQHYIRAAERGEEAEGRGAQPSGQTSPRSRTHTDPSPHTDSNPTANAPAHSDPAGFPQGSAAAIHPAVDSRLGSTSAEAAQRGGRETENSQSNWLGIRL